MKTYLWFNLCISALAIVGKLWLLARADYPRRVVWDRHEDALTIFLEFFIVVWILSLLFT